MTVSAFNSLFFWSKLSWAHDRSFYSLSFFSRFNWDWVMMMMVRCSKSIGALAFEKTENDFSPIVWVIDAKRPEISVLANLSAVKFGFQAKLSGVSGVRNAKRCLRPVEVVNHIWMKPLQPLDALIVESFTSRVEFESLAFFEDDFQFQSKVKVCGIVGTRCTFIHSHHPGWRCARSCG